MTTEEKLHKRIKEMEDGIKTVSEWYSEMHVPTRWLDQILEGIEVGSEENDWEL